MTGNTEFPDSSSGENLEIPKVKSPLERAIYWAMRENPYIVEDYLGLDNKIPEETKRGVMALSYYTQACNMKEMITDGKVDPKEIESFQGEIKEWLAKAAALRQQV